MGKYLVTGGAGFIGSHIVEKLLENDNRVVVLDDFSTGRLENLEHLIDNSNLAVIKGSVSDFTAVQDSMQDCDGVFHQAALVSVQGSIDEPVKSFTNNTLGTFNVFEAARINKVLNVVYATSAAVYGQNDNVPLKESDLPAPLSPYALDKRYAEELANVYFQNYGIRSVGLRYFNVYGPRQCPDSEYSGVISIFIKRLIDGVPVTIFGDGEQTRDFVFVKDVANANSLSMATMKNAAMVYNCGSGSSVTINELYGQIAAAVGGGAVPDFGPARASEVRLSCANIDALQSCVSWQPQVRLDDGLKQLTDYMAAQHQGIIA